MMGNIERVMSSLKMIKGIGLRSIPEVNLSLLLLDLGVDELVLESLSDGKTLMTLTTLT
jgi:hypothetical protein